jgi:uncharacterized protein YkwD
MPFQSSNLSLFSQIVFFSLILQFVHLRPNGYLKLVRYNYTYGIQMAEKNLQKYFIQSNSFSNAFNKIIPSNFPNQKIINDAIPNSFRPSGDYEVIYSGDNADFLNDEFIKKLFADKFHQQVPNQYDFNRNKNNFVPLKPQNDNAPKKPKIDFNKPSPINNRPKNNQGNVNPGPSGKSFEDQVNKFGLQYLNEFRSSNGRSPLSWDHQVFNVSRPHSVAMMNRGKISHDGFDNRADQLEKCFFVYKSAENVAYFMVWEDTDPQKVARKLTDQWINSPGHRKNMLLPDINHVGISIVRKNTSDGQYYYYGTQFFIKK